MDKVCPFISTVVLVPSQLGPMQPQVIKATCAKEHCELWFEDRCSLKLTEVPVTMISESENA